MVCGDPSSGTLLGHPDHGPARDVVRMNSEIQVTIGSEQNIRTCGMGARCIGRFRVVELSVVGCIR